MKNEEISFALVSHGFPVRSSTITFKNRKNMTQIKDIYGIINESREKIINTMLERGLTEVTIVPDEEDYNKEHENNPDFCDTDWSDYKSENAPYVTYLNKWGAGYQYEVLKVHLVKDELLYRFKLEAEENEVGYDTFYDTDCTYMSMANVYVKLEELLGIDNEPEKVVVLYEVDEEDNTKTSIVAMTEADWNEREAETIEKVLCDYFDERYADSDDEYFCYEDEIKQAAAALAMSYEANFNGNPLFWDGIKIVK